MNYIIEIIIYLIINLLICNSISNKTTENNNIENCLTQSGNSGICLPKEYCDDLNISTKNNCKNRQNNAEIVCCNDTSAKKLNPFWAPINNFWNSFQNSSYTTNRPIPASKPSIFEAYSCKYSIFFIF